MSLLEIQQVSKTYARQKRAAVNAVSMTVQPGEFVSLVGESGSGKTTLLRLIAGLEVADEGRIILGDRELSGKGVHVTPEKRGVGLVFQHHALFPHLTVEQNVGFGMTREKGQERRQRIGGLLELIGLPGYEKRYPHELSGGERQRVALARSLAINPGVLLLDEPFSSLDPLLRESMRDETRRVLRACGTTAVLVTHHTRDALAVSDRVAVMNHGNLEQFAPPDEVYHRPANGYVARLFGPCNWLPRGDSGEEGWVRPDDLMLIPIEGGGHRMQGVVVQVSYGGNRQDLTLKCDGFGEVKVCHQGSQVVKEGERWGVVEKR